MHPDRIPFSRERQPREADVIILIPSIHLPRFFVFDTRLGAESGPVFLVEDLAKHVHPATIDFTRKIFTGNIEALAQICEAAFEAVAKKRPDMPASHDIAISAFNNSDGPFLKTPEWGKLLDILAKAFNPERLQEIIKDVLREDRKNYLVELATGDGPGGYFQTLWQR